MEKRREGVGIWKRVEIAEGKAREAQDRTTDAIQRVREAAELAEIKKREKERRLQ